MVGQRHSLPYRKYIKAFITKSYVTEKTKHKAFRNIWTYVADGFLSENVKKGFSMFMANLYLIGTLREWF